MPLWSDLQSRKNYRLLKESVDATRSQAFSESDLQATKIYAGVKGCVNVVTKITHTTTWQSYQSWQAAENCVYSVQKLISLYAFSVYTHDGKTKPFIYSPLEKLGKVAERLSLSFTRGLKRSDLNPAKAGLCNSCKKLPKG
jgi:hypothetical protein